MKNKVIIILFVFSVTLLISFIGIKTYNNKKLKQSEISITEKEQEKETNNDDFNIINNESDQEELTNSKEETVVDQENKIDNSNNTKSTTSSSNSTSTNTNKNENKTIVESPKQNQTIPEEKTPVNTEQPTPTNSYIGVPNPNDFYYSFHKGHIDKNYSTLDGCNSRTAEVGLIDTVDIVNTTCFEVLDGQGTVLGIFMYVKCNSGNCEKYKTLVGIETN